MYSWYYTSITIIYVLVYQYKSLYSKADHACMHIQFQLESEDRVYPQILTGQSVSIIMTPTSDVAACIIFKHALLKKKKLKQ